MSVGLIILRVIRFCFIVLILGWLALSLAALLRVRTGNAQQADKAEPDLWPSPEARADAFDLAAARVAAAICPNMTIDKALWNAALKSITFNINGPSGLPAVERAETFLRKGWGGERYAELCAKAVLSYSRDAPIPLFTRNILKKR